MAVEEKISVPVPIGSAGSTIAWFDLKRDAAKSLYEFLKEIFEDDSVRISREN